MAMGDRSYYGGGYRESPGGSFLIGSPATKGLLIANVAVFAVNWLLRAFSGGWGSVLDEWGAFTIAEGIFGLQIWRLISFQFLHGSLLHLLFNMYALFVFGPIVERWWGSRPFLIYYLVSGLAGALFFALLWAVPGVLEGTHPGTPLVGASAGIFGVLVATAVISPEGRVMLLFPPIPMKMRTFAIGILIFGVFIIVINGRNAGGEAGHLGGALAGYVMMVTPALRSWLRRLER